MTKISWPEFGLEPILTQGLEPGYDHGKAERAEKMEQSLGPELNAALEYRMLLDKVQEGIQHLVDYFYKPEHGVCFEISLQGLPFEVNSDRKVVRKQSKTKVEHVEPRKINFDRSN